MDKTKQTTTNKIKSHTFKLLLLVTVLIPGNTLKHVNNNTSINESEGILYLL